MHKTMRKKNQGYALPLALIYVAIFSIIIASIAPRSRLHNQTIINITNYFIKAQSDKEFLMIMDPNIDNGMRNELIKGFLMNIMDSKTCPTDPNYLIVCNLSNDQVSITISSNDNTFLTTLTYP
jgi:hypothetical protein